MNDNEILDKLKNIFKVVLQRDINLDLIKMDSKIIDDLGVNSIGLIYLMVAIEQEFDIDMSDVAVNTFTYVKDVVKYIEDAI